MRSIYNINREQAAREMGLQQSLGQPRTIAVSFHHSGMPPHILRLFEPPVAPPLMKLPRKRKPEAPYTGVAGYLKYFDRGSGSGSGPPPVAEPEEDAGDEAGPPPLPTPAPPAEEDAGGVAGDAGEIRERLKGKKVAELKEELKEAGLSVTGKKDELVDRLVAHYVETARGGEEKGKGTEGIEDRYEKGEEGEEGEAVPPPLPPMDEGELPPPVPDEENAVPVGAAEGGADVDQGVGMPMAPSHPLDEEPKGLFLNKEMGYQMRIDGPTKLERMIQALQEKQRRSAEAIEEEIKLWDPRVDPNVEGDPLCTLFVGGLSEDVSERKLQREFETYGPIKRVRVVHDRISGKSKGYGFVEFEEKEDMKEAYKQAYGQRIEGKRCMVDVERGRTVPGWKPKRLGGGAAPDKRIVYTLPKNWKKAQLVKVAFQKLGMEVREHKMDRGGGGGGDRGYGGGGYLGGGGYHSRDRGGYRRDDRRGDRGYDRGYEGGRRDYGRDDRHRGYAGRDDRRGGERGYGDRSDRGDRGYGGGRWEQGRNDRRRDRDERDRYDDRHRREDRRHDDRDRYEYRDPKRERISYDDFAAPEAPPATGGDHEEGEI